MRIFPFREKDQGRQYTGDRPGRADERIQTGTVDKDLQESRTNSAKQIEDQILHVPHDVFDIVSEDPEKEHVPADVQPATVEEGAGDHVSRDDAHVKPGEDDTPARHKPVKIVLIECQFIQKNKDIDRNKDQLTQARWRIPRFSSLIGIIRYWRRRPSQTDEFADIRGEPPGDAGPCFLAAVRSKGQSEQHAVNEKLH